MQVLGAVLDALSMAGLMAWQILWPLILGFTLSGVIQAVVRRDRVTAFMSDDSPRSLAWATGLGAASSSCSYASVAIARSLFRKGANLTAAMAFEIASTNLVLELAIMTPCQTLADIGPSTRGRAYESTVGVALVIRELSFRWLKDADHSDETVSASHFASMSPTCQTVTAINHVTKNSPTMAYPT